MKFVNLFNILWLNILCLLYSGSKCLEFSQERGDIVFKFSNDFYQKLETENRVVEFKNQILKKLQKRVNSSSRKLKRISTINMNNYTSTASYDTFISNYEDLHARERNVNFFISSINDCNVLVNDTVLYHHNASDSNFIEHMILNNNVDFVEPKGVFANDININFFVYNKRLNMFTTFFEKNRNVSDYSLEYDYMAVNLVKSQKGYNASLSNNTFLWKFYNENVAKIKQQLNIEFQFSIDKQFEHENVTFFSNSKPVHFQKDLIMKDDRIIVKYSWKINLMPNEVIILEAKFPMYMKNCGNVTIDLPVIVVGSIFIMFLIFVLYILLSHLLKLDEI